MIRAGVNLAKHNGVNNHLKWGVTQVGRVRQPIALNATLSSGYNSYETRQLGAYGLTQNGPSNDRTWKN